MRDEGLNRMVCAVCGEIYRPKPKILIEVCWKCGSQSFYATSKEQMEEKAKVVETFKRRGGKMIKVNNLRGFCDKLVDACHNFVFDLRGNRLNLRGRYKVVYKEVPYRDILREALVTK